MTRSLPVLAAFAHMLRSTRDNLRFAFDISWPWLALLFPLNMASLSFGSPFDPASPGAVSGNFLAFSLLSLFLTLFIFSSVAVNWHRYILRDEVPQGWARLRTDGTVWRYFGRTVLILVILMLASLPVGLLIGIIMAAFGKAALVLVVPIYVALALAAIAFFYRWSISLPAIALERADYGLREAWADSANNFWPLVGLGILFALLVIGMAVLVALVVELVQQVLGIQSVVLMTLAQTALQWLNAIMAVTILTSLYGFFAEKRDF